LDRSQRARLPGLRQDIQILTIPYQQIDKHNIERDDQGHPIFPSRHDIRLPDELVKAPDREQFRDALRQLKNYLAENPAAWKEFTKPQQEALRRAFEGKTKASKGGRIEDFSWHHHPTDEGVLQLVPRDIHKRIGHVGSTALTGRQRQKTEQKP